MYKHILIATDGSDLSKKAVASGLALAASLDAKVLALNVVPAYPTSYFEGAVILNPSEVAKIEQAWIDSGHAIVQDVKTQGQQLHVQVEAITVKANAAAECILATAQKHGCDLIVMASHGRKGFKRFLMGSETLDVLTHSSLPVLVLR